MYNKKQTLYHFIQFNNEIPRISSMRPTFIRHFPPNNKSQKKRSPRIIRNPHKRKIPKNYKYGNAYTWLQYENNDTNFFNFLPNRGKNRPKKSQLFIYI